MRRVQTAGEARCLLPASLCAHIFSERETSGYEAVTEPCFSSQWLDNVSQGNALSVGLFVCTFNSLLEVVTRYRL